MAKEKPAQAAKLFADVIAMLPDSPEPAEASWMLNTATLIAPFARDSAIAAIERVMKSASSPEYGAKTAPTMIGAFAAISR